MKIIVLNTAKLLALSLIIWSFTNCSSSSGVQYLSPEYKDKKEPNSNVLVIPLISKSLIKNSVVDSLTADNKEIANSTSREKEIFDNYIKIIIEEKSQTRVVFKDQLINYSAIKFEDHVADVSGQRIEFQIPVLTQFSNKKEPIDFILLFDELNFSRNFDIDGSSLGRAGEASYTLKGGFEYLIYDVKYAKVVSYGKISEKTKLLVVPQKDDYVTVIDKLAEDVIAKSPFIARRIYF